MYNQNYEDYMRSILGYSNDYNNTYENNEYRDYNYSNNYANSYNTSNLEQLYPEIYNIVYPMVKKACRNNNRGITKEYIDDLTNEIYSALEDDGSVSLNINLENRSISNSTGQSINKEKIENKNVENRQFGNRNPYLNDLIRILLLRELLGRPNFFPPFPGPRPPFPGPRPPFPGPGPRPPRPGGPGFGRPPMMPRDYEDDYMNY